MARKWREYPQNCPRVGPQVHGLRAGMMGLSRDGFNGRGTVFLMSFANLFFLNLLLQIKRLIGSDKEALSILERFVAGSLAGVIAQSTIYPMEVIISLIRSIL